MNDPGSPFCRKWDDVRNLAYAKRRIVWPKNEHLMRGRWYPQNGKA